MKVDFHLKAYVCIHVFSGERPVLLVDRADGEWCLLCGEEHDDNPELFRLVGIGHIVERDPSLNAILDLPGNWEAERLAPNETWQRRPVQDTERIESWTH